MHVVIPMSGVGRRFQEAGYIDPKPLIRVDDKLIIEHVADLFPGEEKITFVCSKHHLETTGMRQELERIRPGARIVGIEPHKKGPVFAVSNIYDLIDDEEEVIVNYCDFSVYWDYADFLAHTRGRGADGAIPAYRGFHPHMLGATNYAFMRDDNQWMLEIQEKKPFTDNRMQEFASDGTYYFRTGAILKRYFEELMRRDINLSGEYYVSMVYNLLVEDGLKVSIYEVQHMLQWGTPDDLEEYIRWSDYHRRILEFRPGPPPEADSINLIPMAGHGSRFAREGYKLPKPLIPVSGKPMVVQAADFLPPAEGYTFVCLRQHLENHSLGPILTATFPSTRIVPLDGVTEGQAITCNLGIAPEDLNKPLLVGTCDNGILFDTERYATLRDDPGVDAIIFSFRGNPTSKRSPQMYGWIRTAPDGRVTGVSVKKPISDDPIHDHAVVGTFFFRRAEIFLGGLVHLQSNNIRVNGEFYVDSLMQSLVDLGYKVKVFEVTDYTCWGTPNDLKTFTYWQSFFHKCPWHPYTLELDPTVAPEAAATLNASYRSFSQGQVAAT